MLAPWEYFWQPWTAPTAAQQRINIGEQIGGLVTKLITAVAYTIIQNDCGRLLSFNNAAAIAVTLGAASGFTQPFWFWVENRGAGAVTITATGTIDGAGTLTVNQNKGALIQSDGTNFFTERGGT